MVRKFGTKLKVGPKYRDKNVFMSKIITNDVDVNDLKCYLKWYFYCIGILFSKVSLINLAKFMGKVWFQTCLEGFRSPRFPRVIYQ